MRGKGIFSLLDSDEAIFSAERREEDMKISLEQDR